MDILTKETGLPTDPAEPMTFPLTAEDKALIKAMIATSKRIGGYGLAAPQVGINKQLFVYRTSSTGNNYQVVMNPEVTAQSGKVVSKNEGCLSAPGVRKDIKRSKVFNLTYVDENCSMTRVRPINKKLSIVLQHEFDHLNGKTILDR